MQLEKERALGTGTSRHPPPLRHAWEIQVQTPGSLLSPTQEIKLHFLYQHKLYLMVYYLYTILLLLYLSLIVTVYYLL